MADVNISKLDAGEIEQMMSGLGEYMARLLVVSGLSDEQKEAWAVLVPEMTLEQLLKFAAVLERYVDTATLPELAELRTKLEAIKAEYDAEIAQMTSQAKSNLAAVMQEVKAAEAAA